MKKLNFLFILLYAVFVTSCCNYNCDKETLNNTEVRAGQMWVYEHYPENPFEKPIIDTCYVIEVRGDYIKYKKNGKILTESDSIINVEWIGYSNTFWFKLGSRRIK
jgi:hypothetical protein